MKDYTNTWLDAMSILINKKIESIKFDQTVTAIITDDRQADKGIYQVTEDQVHTYQAYSSVTDYKNNDSVLVTIPCGDYENQKMIVGKAVTNKDSPIIYTSPFSTIIDISNNLITRNLGEQEMWANGNTYQWPMGVKQFPGENNQYGMTCIWDSKDSSQSVIDAGGEPHLNLAGYTRLGLQTQIATYLDDYSTILGNYGLSLELTFRNANLPEGQNSFIKYITFDSDEYFGDVYSFDTFYTQEAVYDIKEYSNNNFAIDRIRLYMYQRHNFIDVNGQLIPSPENEDDFSNIGPNIVFKDFYICVGTAAEGFDNDDLRLICNNNLDYYKHTETVTRDDLNSDNNYLAIKAIMQIAQSKLYENPNIIAFKEGLTDNLQDIIDGTDVEKVYKALNKIDHLNVPNKDMPIDELERYKNDYNISDENLDILIEGYPAFKILLERLRRSVGRLEYNTKELEAVWLHKDDTTGIIARVEEGQIPAGYEIYWYRYALGAPSPDMFAGPHWERFYGCRPEADDKEDYCITFEELAVAKDRGEEIDIATNHVEVNFIPNVNNAEEQIKAIIVITETRDEDGSPLIQRYVASSEPIVFTNNDEVRNQATVIDLNTLAIRIDDKSQGKYFLYNRSDTLDGDLGNRIHSLTAVFDPIEPDVNKKAELNSYSSIKWTFPSTNTMIIPATTSTEYGVPAQSTVFTNVISVGYFINKKLDRYATNNTVQLEVVVDGVNYEADVTLFFGTAGTSGSDYTLVLNWKNVNSALDVTYPGWDSLKGEVALQDRNGEYIDIPNDSQIDYDWLVGDMIYEEEENNYEFELEDRDLYYPIFNNDQDAIFDTTCNETKGFFTEETTPFRQSNEDTYGGYYYYLDPGYQDLSEALSQKLQRKISYNITSQKFNLESGFVAISDYTSSIAFFDLNEETYMPIMDTTTQIHIEDGYIYTANNEKIEQFYRKRKNELNLTKTQIINKDEHFFKSIYDIMYPNQNIYQLFFDTNTYWPEVDSSNYLIQNQDNMINTTTSLFEYPIGSNNLISITDYFLDELINNNVSSKKSDLNTWINNFRQTTRVFYHNDTTHATYERFKEDYKLEEELLELIFNIKNIYEYILNKLKSQINLTNLNSLPYYYYSTSQKQFILFSNTSYLTEDNISNAIEDFIFGTELLYNLDGYENIDNKIYEFSKPKIEFIPLSLITDTTEIANSTGTNYDPYNNGIHSAIFEGSNSAIADRNDDKDFYKEIYYMLYNKSYSGNNVDSYLTNLINDLATLYSEESLGYTSKQSGKNAVKSRNYWKDKKDYLNDPLTIINYFFKQLELVKAKNVNNDYLTSFSENEEDNINSLCEKFYTEFVLSAKSIGLSYLFNKAGQSVKTTSVNNTNLIYSTMDLNNSFSKDYLNIYNSLTSEPYIENNNGSIRYLTSKFYTEVLMPIISNINSFYLLKDESITNWWKAIYCYLTHNSINDIDLVDSVVPSLSQVLNNYFETSNSNYQLKLKLKENLSSDNNIWIDENRNYLFEKIRSGMNLVKFYQTYIAQDNNNLYSLRRLITDEENQSFIEEFDKFLKSIFTPTTGEAVDNKIKGVFLQGLISKTSAIDQNEAYQQLNPINFDRLNDKTTNGFWNVLGNPSLKNIYYNTSSYELQYRYVLNYIYEQIINGYDVNTVTPIATTLAIYKMIYGVLSNSNTFRFTSDNPSGESSTESFFELLNSLLFKSETALDSEDRIFNELIYEEFVATPTIVFSTQKNKNVVTVYKNGVNELSFNKNLYFDDNAIINLLASEYRLIEPPDESHEDWYEIKYMGFSINDTSTITNIKGDLKNIREMFYKPIQTITYYCLYHYWEQNSNDNWVRRQDDRSITKSIVGLNLTLMNLLNTNKLKYNSDLRATPPVLQTLSKSDINDIILGKQISNNKTWRSFCDSNAMLLWLRCLNKFINKNRFYSFNFSETLADNTYLLIRKTKDEVRDKQNNIINNENYYYYNTNTDFQYYNSNYITSEQLNNLASTLLNKYIYDDDSISDQNTNSTTYNVLSLCLKDADGIESRTYYKGIPCKNNEILKLLFTLFCTSNLEITLIDKYEVMFRDINLLWKYLEIKQESNNDETNIKEIALTGTPSFNFSDYLINNLILSEDESDTIEDYFINTLNSFRTNVIAIYPTDENATDEINNAQKESQLHYFKELTFSFLTNFYQNLNTNVNIKTQVISTEERNNFIINFYNFIANSADSNIDSITNKLQQFFTNTNDSERRIQHLFSLIPEELNYTNNLDYLVGVDSQKNILYNIKYEIQNISTQSWLYQVLNNLNQSPLHQIQYNINSTEILTFDSIKRLQTLEEFAKENPNYPSDEDEVTNFVITQFQNILKGFLSNTNSEIVNNPINYIKSTLFEDDLENNRFGSLKFICDNATSLATSYDLDSNFQYKIIYSNKLCKLYEIFKKDLNSNDDKYNYITTRLLIQMYRNILQKNTIYKNVSDSISIVNEETKVFNYYNRNHKKAFVNINGYYVLDPYMDWMNEVTYYEPIQVRQYKSKTHPLRYTARSLGPNQPNVLVEVYPKINLTAEQLMNSLSVLKVTLSHFGDYDLVACFPIALRNGTQTSEQGQIKFEAKYLNGATEVRYSTAGTTEYNKNPYQLFLREYSVEDGIQLYEAPGNEEENWNILIPSKALYDYDTGNFVPILSHRILKPSPVYIPNLEGYGIQYIRYPDDDDRRIILWTQPIYSYEDNYPSSTLNAWNGKDIYTDNDTGTIVASALAAGKKERDNTFTGVMIGDWSRSDTDVAIAKQTGLYGFYHGSMSYAFKDDGSGFIGKDGRGRIYFNGTNSTIYSSMWLGNEPLGMLLDIDDGVIELRSKTFKLPTDEETTRALEDAYNNYSFERSVTVNGVEHSVSVDSLDIESLMDSETGISNKYISINSQDPTYPLTIGYQKAPGSRNFKVRWDGTTYITNGIFSGMIHGKGGYLDNNFIVNGTLYGGTFLGGNVYTSYLESTRGNIGGWQISSNALINTDGTTVLYGKTQKFEDLSTGDLVSNPMSISIITNRIRVSATGMRVIKDAQTGDITMEASQGVTADMGYIQGATATWDPDKNAYTNYRTTDLVGIKAFSGEGVAVEAAVGNVGVRGAGGVFLTAGYGTGNQGGSISLGSNGSVSIKGEQEGHLNVWGIPADRQHGIYARFA